MLFVESIFYPKLSYVVMVVDFKTFDLGEVIPLILSLMEVEGVNVPVRLIRLFEGRQDDDVTPPTTVQLKADITKSDVISRRAKPIL